MFQITIDLPFGTIVEEIDTIFATEAEDRALELREEQYTITKENNKVTIEFSDGTTITKEIKEYEDADNVIDTIVCHNINTYVDDIGEDEME